MMWLKGYKCCRSLEGGGQHLIDTQVDEETT